MANTLDLSSTVAKVNRAYEHFKALHQEVSDFLNDGFIEVETKTYRRVLEWRQYPRSVVEAFGFDQRFRFREVNDDTLETRVPVRYDSVTVTLKKSIPALRWAVLIGDVVSNLRGALDNLVWALTEANGHIAPNPVPGGKWRRIGFPVVRDPRDWKKTTNDVLWGLRPRQQACLKKLQPFYGRKQPLKGPERHWLYMLTELWNADKHRTIHIVSVNPGFPAINLGPHELMQLLEVKFIWARPPRPFIDSTEEVARFQSSMRQGVMMGHVEANVQMNLDALVAIAFDEGAPAYGASVMETLMRFLNRVTAVILEFKPDISEPLPVVFVQRSPSHVPPLGATQPDIG